MDERPTIEPIVIKPTSPAAAAESVVAPSTAQSVPGADFVAFDVQVQRSGLMESLKGFTSRLAEALAKAAEDITSLEVSTYTSSDLVGVKYDFDTKKLSGEVKLRA